MYRSHAYQRKLETYEVELQERSSIFCGLIIKQKHYTLLKNNDVNNSY